MDPFNNIALEESLLQLVPGQDKISDPIVTSAPPEVRWDPFTDRDGGSVPLSTRINSNQAPTDVRPAFVSSDEYLLRLSNKLGRLKNKSKTPIAKKGYKYVNELKAMNECLANDLIHHNLASWTAEMQGSAAATSLERQPMLADISGDDSSCGLTSDRDCSNLTAPPTLPKHPRNRDVAIKEWVTFPPNLPMDGAATKYSGVDDIDAAVAATKSTSASQDSDTEDSSDNTDDMDTWERCFQRVDIDEENNLGLDEESLCLAAPASVAQ